jgi:serine/threonine-protein kinase
LTEISVGDVVAGWTVERELGAGGMGRVYLARHPRLPRQDVLKVIAGDLAKDPSFRQRFLREADVVARLQHPHVVVVHDRGDYEDLLYIAMQYVPGGDLRRLLDASVRLGVARALTIAQQVASALDSAHAIGLVHRDVKPENVLLAATPDGSDHAILADFGISRVETPSSPALTATGTFLATPGYAAPELVQGLPIDGRVDQYALACLIFEMLSGALPFPGESSMAALVAHVHTPPPNLSDVAPGLPRRLDEVLRRGLAKDPRQRYRTCGELVAAARTAAREPAPEPAPVPAPETAKPPPIQRAQPSPPTAVSQPARRRSPAGSGRRWLMPAGVVALVAIIVGGAAVALGRGKHGAVPAPPTSHRTAEVLQAGRDFATKFLSPDYRAIDAFTTEIPNLSTGAFRAEFVKKSGQLKAQLMQTQTVETGTVLDAAAKNVTPDSAVVLLIADARVTRRDSPPATNRYRVQITLQRAGNLWLTSEFTPDSGGGCDDATASPDAREALQQGCENMTRIFSYDYRTLDFDLAAARAATTGAFADEVGKTSDSIQPVAAKYHVVVRATVLGAALQSADDRQAAFLAFLDQAVTNDTMPAPRLDRNRVVVQLTKVDNRWLVSGLKAL